MGKGRDVRKGNYVASKWSQEAMCGGGVAGVMVGLVMGFVPASPWLAFAGEQSNNMWQETRGTYTVTSDAAPCVAAPHFHDAAGTV